MSSRRRSTLEERDHARTLFEAGDSLTAIGKALGRSTTTIATWAARQEWARPHTHSSDSTAAARSVRRASDMARWTAEADRQSALLDQANDRLATAIQTGDATTAATWSRVVGQLTDRALALVAHTTNTNNVDPRNVDPEELGRGLAALVERCRA